MTREEARQNLVALGIEEPSETQVSDYLDQFHSDRNPAPNPNPAPNSSPKPGNEPQNGEELQNALNRIKELEKENAKKDILTYASSKGLSGEQVQNVLNAFGDNVDVAKSAIDSMAQIISDNRASAAQEKEAEIARNASNPGGGSGGGGGEEKTTAEKIAAKMFGNKKQNNDVLSHYVNGGN